MIEKRQIMTSSEAAEYLGIKRSYLYKMTMRKVIPYFKPGGKMVFFAKEDLDRWLTNSRISSQAEIDEEAAHYIVKH